MKIKFSRNITIGIVFTAILFFLLPASALAAEKVHRPVPGGHIPVDVEILHGDGGMSAQEGGAAFPARYDSREQSWYQGVRVVDQGNTNLCWACAASAAARISYAKETAGARNTQTSPVQLGYYYYNRTDDPLGSTAGDVNDRWYDHWYDEGGNVINTLQHMATWSGLTDDSRSPMLLNEDYDYIGLGRTGYPMPSSLEFSENIMTLENAVYYDALDWEDEGDRNMVKSLLTRYGAVVVSMEYDDRYFAYGDSEGEAYYHPAPVGRNNHEVVIVGWDDDYSRDDFHSATARNRWRFNRQPMEDGAWIVLNSWGDEIHDGGYFYASYESSDILADGICAFDMQGPSDYRYNFQYDGNAAQTTFRMSAGEKAANVFRAPEGRQIRLGAVGMTAWNDAATEYQIDVYTGLTSPHDPESGALAVSFRTSTDSPGYKTIDLPREVVVDGGEDYAIVVSFLNQKTLFGIEETYHGSKGDFTAHTEMGQSFGFDADLGQWIDMGAAKMCFRIKGLAGVGTCSHNYQLLQTAAPTQDTDGYTLYQCSACGHSYKTDLTLRENPVPDTVLLKSAKAGRGTVTVRWFPQIQLLAGQPITGVQVRASLKKNMKGAKTATAAGAQKKTAKIRGLKLGKKYYIQARAYFISPEDGRAYYSDWSKKLSVKTK